MRRPLLLPLVPLYGAALVLKRWLFAGEPKRLTNPVISVGSLSAGGAGKTPVVAALTALLLRHGFAVDVLSRGYGRSSNTVELVDPAGEAARFGDEPLLLARQTGAPVYVGADRYAAGRLAEDGARQGPRLLHLLDDGFQHRRLGRDLDLILLTGEDLADHLLPAGNLREPLARLRAADVVLVREEEEALLRPAVRRLAGAAMPVWLVRRSLKLTLPADGSAPQKMLAVCGIARPQDFLSMLAATGITPVGSMAFRDHHVYRGADIDPLLAEARRVGADGFVTTEKDAVKLSPAMILRLGVVGPVRVAALRVVFADEGGVVARVEAMAGQRSSVRR